VGSGGQFTICQSKHGFSCTWSKANPLLHEGLGAHESMVLVHKHSCKLPAPWDGDRGMAHVPIPGHWQVAAAVNGAPASADTASNCSWVTCASLWVGVWAAELFLCLPSLSPDCSRIPQAPSAPSRACGIADVKHRLLVCKETGFLTSVFSLSKFFKPCLPISCVAHRSS